jgi:hypothetical protein
MSGLPPQADLHASSLQVSEVPKAAIGLPYSITASARSRNDSGIVRSSAFAVVRLMTRSNLVGRSTGMSVRLRPAQNLVDKVGIACLLERGATLRASRSQYTSKTRHQKRPSETGGRNRASIARGRAGADHRGGAAGAQRDRAMTPIFAIDTRGARFG